MDVFQGIVSGGLTSVALMQLLVFAIAAVIGTVFWNFIRNFIGHGAFKRHPVDEGMWITHGTATGTADAKIVRASMGRITLEYPPDESGRVRTRYIPMSQFETEARSWQVVGPGDVCREDCAFDEDGERV